LRRAVGYPASGSGLDRRRGPAGGGTLDGVIDLNSLSLPALFTELTKDGSVQRLVALARWEDLRDAGDVTTASIIEPDRRAEATLVARAAGVVAGLAALDTVLKGFDAAIAATPRRADGQACRANEPLAALRGPLAGMLTVERTLLNLLGRLSGIATLTRRYVDAVAGTGAVICETRKTTPGLRSLEKYAVRCGGGTLHRLGLHDAALYKDNHLAHLPLDRLGETLTEAIGCARDAADLRFVEVEIDTLTQLASVLALEEGLIDVVLLDNMAVDELRRAVAMRDERAPGVQLEASGGVTLETVRPIAESGVDRISVGALTHSAVALDVGLDIA
jgi:nicotinate-nucleotide pyrophosphorylase (carboxylating)